MSYKKDEEFKDNEKINNMLMALPSYVRSYITHIQFSTSAKTRLEYVRDITSFLEYVCNEYTEDGCRAASEVSLSILENLSLDFLNSYPQYLSQYKKNGQIRTNSNVSIKRKLSVLKNFYAYLYMNDLISKNETVKIAVPKTPKKNIVKLDETEAKDFLHTVHYGTGKASSQKAAYHEILKMRDYSLISLLLGTGIRVSECVGLDMSDVDLEHYCIKVIRKGGKEDIIYMSDELTDIMRDYMDYREGIDVTENEKALFLSIQKKRIGVRTVEILVKKYKQDAGLLKNITPHKLRSTFGTTLYEKTGDLYLVAETLGHASVETTRKHYADISNKHKQENRNKVNWVN